MIVELVNEHDVRDMLPFQYQNQGITECVLGACMYPAGPSTCIPYAVSIGLVQYIVYQKYIILNLVYMSSTRGVSHLRQPN